MLKNLRIQLTLLFLSAGILLVGSIGAVLYLRLEGFFRSSTDIALKYRLALELRNLQAPISPEIEEAEQDFLSRLALQSRQSTPTTFEESEMDEDDSLLLLSTPSTTPVLLQPTVKPTRKPVKSTQESDNEDGEEGEHSEEEEKRETETQEGSWLIPTSAQSPRNFLAAPVRYQLETLTPTPSLSGLSTLVPHPETEIDNEFNSELAAIFVNHIDLSGSVIQTAFTNRSPYKPEMTSILGAQSTGMDLRTVTTTDGTPVRYLTYKLPEGFPAGYIQLGRKINDQRRLLNDYLMNMGILGIIVLVILGIGSWWIAGRAVLPTQRSLDQQQSFIANASHELRSPLTLIRASTELAARNAAPGEGKQLMGEVLKDVDYMARLVEDLLLLSRLDTQKITLSLKPVPIETLFAELKRQFDAITSGGATRLIINSIPGQVMADPDRMRQLLWILIDNALQHTATEGTILLSAQQDGNLVHLMVTDNGSGIPKEDIPYVFNRFFKGRNAKSKSHGAGLGLSIARSLAEAQNGIIHLDSLAGKGTRVTISVNKAGDSGHS
jgi:signal transduction histidine kinase